MAAEAQQRFSLPDTAYGLNYPRRFDLAAFRDFFFFAPAGFWARFADDFRFLPAALFLLAFFALLRPDAFTAGAFRVVFLALRAGRA